jgi:hypothetical protein
VPQPLSLSALGEPAHYVEARVMMPLDASQSGWVGWSGYRPQRASTWIGKPRSLDNRVPNHGGLNTSHVIRHAWGFRRHLRARKLYVVLFLCAFCTLRLRCE